MSEAGLRLLVRPPPRPPAGDQDPGARPPAPGRGQEEHQDLPHARAGAG